MSTEQVAGDQLRAFCERIERLNEEAKTIKDDVKDVYAEAKASGFTVAVLRKIVKDRAKDPNERSEFETIYDLYAQALGMQRSLDFGSAS